jgi:hypothetical protein
MVAAIMAAVVALPTMPAFAQAPSVDEGGVPVNGLPKLPVVGQLVDELGLPVDRLLKQDALSGSGGAPTI